MSRLARLGAFVALVAGLALSGYVLYALGGIDPKYLLVFQGTSLVFLVGIPLLLVGGATGFLTAPGTKVHAAASVVFALAALYIVWALVHLFSYMLRVSHGL